MVPLLTNLEGRFPIARHEHVAVLYRGSESALRFASFLGEGLESGDYCYFVAPAHLKDGMLDRLRGLRPALDSYLLSGQLVFDSGTSDPAVLRERLKRAFTRAEQARAPALRWLENAGWAESGGLPQADYFEFHALMNYQVKHYPSAAICQFSLDSLDTHWVCSAISVHRHLLIENSFVRDNPFYVPPEKYLSVGEKERHLEVEKAFRDVGFDLDKFLAALEGYGRLHPGIVL